MSADKNGHKPSTKHTLEEVLRALQDLVRNELADADAGAAKPGVSPPAASRATQSPPPAAPASEPELPDAVIADTELSAPVPAASGKSLPERPADNPTLTENELPVLTEVVVPHPPQPARRKTKPAAEQVRQAPEQTSINWDDIPVLSEAVESPTAALAASARDIACKAVARLNIELRKAGQSPLDPAIINRLEAALRDTLLGVVTDKQEPPRH